MPLPARSCVVMSQYYHRQKNRILQLRLLAYRLLTEHIALLMCATTLLEVKMIKKNMNQREVSIFLLSLFRGTESVTVKNLND